MSDWDKTKQFKDELAAANAKVKVLEAKQSELDPETAELEQVAKQLNETRTEVAALQVSQDAKDKELAAREETVKAAETDRKRQEQQTANTQQGQSVIDDMLNKLDKEYSPEFRNTAFNAADKLFGDNPISKQNEKGEFIVDADTRRAWIETNLETQYRLAQKESKKTDVGTETKVNPIDPVPGIGGSGKPIPTMPTQTKTMEESATAYMARQQALAASGGG